LIYLHAWLLDSSRLKEPCGHFLTAELDIMIGTLPGGYKIHKFLRLCGSNFVGIALSA